jgi:hypothetical protein
MNSLTSLIIYIYHVEYIMTKSSNENKKRFKEEYQFKNVDWLKMKRWNEIKKELYSR